jgi:hypothetical protein
MHHDLTKLYQSVITFLEKKEQTGLDEPYFKKGSILYTKRDLINELVKGSEIGQLLINDSILLAIDMLSRDKEKTDNFEKVKEEEKNDK